MTDDSEAALDAFRRELIQSAATLYAIQRLSGDEVRKQSKQAYHRLVDAHLLITGVLATGLLRINQRLVLITPASEERQALFASYVVGMETCERAIEEGRYLQALVLLRQEMETLAQLKAVAAGKRNQKGSPNVSVLGPSLSRLYDDLSAAAHVSKPHVIRAVTGGHVSGQGMPEPTSQTRYFPAFAQDLARRSFGLHLTLTLRLIEELSDDLHEQFGGNGFTDREVKAIDLAVELMTDEGVLEQGNRETP